MTMAREPWATQIGTTEPRIMGKRGGPSTGRPCNFDSSTCAAGEQEAPRFEVVILTLRVITGEFLYAHSPRRTTSVEISGVSRWSL